MTRRPRYRSRWRGGPSSRRKRHRDLLQRRGALLVVLIPMGTLGEHVADGNELVSELGLFQRLGPSHPAPLTRLTGAPSPRPCWTVRTWYGIQLGRNSEVIPPSERRVGSNRGCGPRTSGLESAREGKLWSSNTSWSWSVKPLTPPA
jgi:hypothetical protein